MVTVDPSRRRVLARSSFEGAQLVGTAKAGREIVLLLASGGLGRLGVVDERGAVRSVALEVPVGVQPREATFARPGLAVDPVLRRAFVVPSAGPVAEVALDTLAVAYHELNAPASRVIAAFRPAVRAKELPVTTRTAEWLGNGKLVVSGIGGSAGPEQPGGLALIDTGTWSIQTLEGGTDSFAVSEGRIVATGPRAGLAVFDRDGRLLYRRFAGRRSRVEMIHRGRVYVHVGGERDMRALELVSGNDVGRRALPLPRLLLEISG
ncbi:MAG: hypothetical protein H0V45_09845 [Actinobacteria bacterium]|nr:hypothetical protein [Actinomycetota bacterium]